MRRLGFVVALVAFACGGSKQNPGPTEQAPTEQPSAAKPDNPAPTTQQAGQQTAEQAGQQTAEAVDEQPKKVPLEYHEVMLGGAGPSERVPMIVAIHGLGDQPKGFMHLFSGFPEKARLILPRALEPHGEGYSWFPTRARDKDTEALAQGMERAARYVAAAIEVLHEQRPTVGKPIVTGFSQGGMLTFALAIGYPDAVGLAVPVSGWLPPPLWPEHKPDAAPAIFALHGTNDNAVSYAKSKRAIEHLSEQGFATTLKTYKGVRHVITDEMRRDLHDRLAEAVRTASKAEP